MQSKAKTVEQYLKELPPERRADIQAVREVILKNLDPAYQEGMQYGMISYYVPHSVYPPGYHCDPKQPLPFTLLASQKNYLSLYMMPVYGEAETSFREEWVKTGKKLDMGKCCIRFKKAADLALDLIAKVIKRTPAKKWIAFYEATMVSNKVAKEKRSAARKKAAGGKRRADAKQQRAK